MSENEANSTSEFPMPENSTYLESDWHILAGFWHPIALSRDTGNKPIRVTLLDVPLVVYRTDSGVFAAYDRCPHRGARLSDGAVCDGKLVCPFHAFNFDEEGRCTLVPAHGPEFSITPKMRLNTFKVEEKYGLVWVCLKNNPTQPLPVYPPYDNPGDELYVHNMEPAIWNASPLRHAENFNDMAHLHCVHAKTVGDIHAPSVVEHVIEETEFGLVRKMELVAQPRASLSEPIQPGVTISSEYIFTFPFTSVLVMVNPTNPDFENTEMDFEEHLMDTICPISATKIAIFMVKGRTYLNEDKYTQEVVDYQDAINEEDRKVVEGQYPQLASLESNEEIPIPADKWYFAFRRRWREMGFKNKAAD